MHSDAEERHFYKPLLDNDMMQEKARHGIAEHHDIDELIEKFEETEQESSSSWLKIAKDLRHQVEHHLEDEEQSYFKLSGKVFSETQKKELASEYRKHMENNL